MSDEPDARVVERRRFPRIQPPADFTLTVPTVVDAEVMDLSVGGALISTTSPLRVGQRARLRTLLGREPFNAWFEVRRTEAGTMGAQTERHRLGVAFTAIQEQARRTLLRFVRQDDKSS